MYPLCPIRVRLRPLFLPVAALALALASVPSVELLAADSQVKILDVQPRCYLRESRERNETATLTVEGLPEDQDLRVWVNGKDAEVTSREGDQVEVEFVLYTVAETGPKPVEVRVGDRSYIWHEGIFVVEKPRIEFTGGSRTLQAGRSFDITQVGVPLSELSVTLERVSLESTPTDATLKVSVPWGLSGDESELTIMAFGQAIWSDDVTVIPSPGVQDVTATLDQESKELRVSLYGHHLDEDVVVGCWSSTPDNEVELNRKPPAGNMIELTGEMTEGIESTESVLAIKVVWAGRTLYERKGGWVSRINYDVWTWNPSDSTERNARSEAVEDPGERLDGIVLDRRSGEIHIGNSTYDFVFIPERTGSTAYVVGLTEEQRDDPYLLKRGFSEVSASLRKALVSVPLLHPFLIQRSEVSCDQYWQYLSSDEGSEAHVPSVLQSHYKRFKRWEETELPEDIASLPVTGLSYLDVVPFIEWLQAELGTGTEWRIRLPHEIEWEMAARADDRKYSFPNSTAEEALESIRTPGLRAVCSNRYDKSDRGVCDMTGNVSELTCTHFDRDMLTTLDAKRKALLFEGWDPRDPFLTEGLITPLPSSHKESAPVAVRGGANGEPAPLLQVGVRRSREWSDRDDLTGFRLALVKVTD
ncbi:MAG: SUMF1/EgtB/PvdO family nonheme iron enzyme [Candidatus Eisenbacteria bacterium]